MSPRAELVALLRGHAACPILSGLGERGLLDRMLQGPFTAADYPEVSARGPFGAALAYLVSLGLCLLFVPFKPFAVEWVAGFVIPWLWLGLVISVGAQLLLGWDLDNNLLNGGLALFAVGGYSKLLGDAADTPFTAERGSANQWLAGAGIAYTF